MWRRAREGPPSITASGEDRHIGSKTMNRAVVHVQGDHATATAFVHDEVDGKIFDIELRRMAQRLAVHRVQHGVAGAIGGGAGALGGALAVMCGHAAEGTLIDLAIFLAAREWQGPTSPLPNTPPGTCAP